MLQGDVSKMDDVEIARQVEGLREWLSQWQGGNWMDPTGATIPIAKSSVQGLLDALERARAERDALH